MVTVERPRFWPDPSIEHDEMEALQRELAELARFGDDLGFDPPALEGVSAATDDGLEGPDSDQPVDGPIVAGIDQAFRSSTDPEAGPGEFDEAVSAVVAMQEGEVIERASAVEPLEIPYIPGLLAFREGASILAALEALDVEPDLLLFDGSGRIHYREAGLATHVGVAVDLPAIGVAKSLLCGEPQGELDDRDAGTVVPIEADDEVETAEGTIIGAAVQTRQFESSRQSINPVYVSPGHRVSWETAAELALATADGYKLPEPIRRADSWVDELAVTPD